MLDRKYSNEESCDETMSITGFSTGSLNGRKKSIDEIAGELAVAVIMILTVAAVLHYGAARIFGERSEEQIGTLSADFSVRSVSFGILVVVSVGAFLVLKDKRRKQKEKEDQRKSDEDS